VASLVKKPFKELTHPLGTSPVRAWLGPEGSWGSLGAAEGQLLPATLAAPSPF